MPTKLGIILLAYDMITSDEQDKITEEKINCWRMKGTSNCVKSLEVIKKLKFKYERLYSIQDFLKRLPTMKVPVNFGNENEAQGN